MDDQFQYPPQRGDYPPPPPLPPYPVTSDIPPNSPYHRSPQPRSSNRNSAGWLTGIGAALVAFLKYGGLLLLKIPALGTLLSVLLSFGAYSWAAGPAFAVALIAMLFIHEMGHVVEIRRQGMQATAPIFIPFLGAAIFQRSHPTTALKQAQVGIAGPIAGTIGATVAYFLFFSTGWPVFIIAAVWGFALNLFNLIPVWQLDGSWILAPVSKWVYVAGYALVVVAVLWLHSIFLIIIALFGISSLINRFRTADSPYYTAVPAQARWALAAAWLTLVVYLGFMTEQALNFYNPFVR
jgi:Zn-dependent protease